MKTVRTSNIKHFQLAPWGCHDPAVFDAALAEMLSRDVIFLPEHLTIQAYPYLGDRVTPEASTQPGLPKSIIGRAASLL